MGNYFISVVIPAFNEEKYLSATLEALKKQDYPTEDYEIIVVDHNSTDKTGDVAREAGAKVVLCKEKTISAARQAGFEQARGEIFAGTDADTTHPSDWLAKINEIFQTKGEIVAVTGGAKFDSKSALNRVLADYFFPIFMELQFRLGKKALNGFNFAARAEAFKQIGGFDKELISAEDVDLGVRLAQVGKVIFAPQLIAVTSARRIEKSRLKFLRQNLTNVINFLILRKKKTEKFEVIR